MDRQRNLSIMYIAIIVISGISLLVVQTKFQQDKDAGKQVDENRHAGVMLLLFVLIILGFGGYFRKILLGIQ
jgi:hypothetical protein